MKKQEYWFPAKRYGWGWGMPTTWQGWIVLLAYVAVLVTLVLIFPPGDRALPLFAGVGVATLVLIAICWAKGEPPRWRWGKH
jgi:hypothetical protein